MTDPTTPTPAANDPDLIAYFNAMARMSDENAANVTNAEIRMICEEYSARCRMVVAELTRLRARVAELEAEKAASWRAERDRFYKGLVRQAESLAAMAQRLGGEAEERGERNKHENALLTVVKENKELRDRVAELERENQTQRDMMQGKDDAIAELSFTVKELEAQVAALTDAKERQP